MFYTYNNEINVFKKTKTQINLRQKYILKRTRLLNYHLLQFAQQSVVQIFKKNPFTSYNTRLSLVTRLSRLSSLNIHSSKQILNKIINSLVNQYSFNVLYFFIKRLFWLVPVPKHKQLAYFLRALLKEVNRFTNTWRGISLTLRGKLAATGNKRKSVFTYVVGTGSASKLNLQNSIDFRLFRTPTGVLGVTSIITYTR